MQMSKNPGQDHLYQGDIIKFVNPRMQDPVEKGIWLTTFKATVMRIEQFESLFQGE